MTTPPTTRRTLSVRPSADSADEASRPRVRTGARARHAKPVEPEQKPATQKPREGRPAGDRPPRRDGNKPRPQGARRDGDADRPPRREFGDRSASGERRPYGDRPPRSTFNERGASDERRPYDNRRSDAAGSAGPRDRSDAPPRREFGDRNPAGERRPYGDRSAPGERRPYGDRPPRSTFNERGASDERRPYDNRRSDAVGSAGPRDRSDAPRRFDSDRRDAPPRREFGDRSAPGERRPYGDRPPRSTFNERGATGERRPYDDRRNDAAGSAGPRDRSDAPRRFDSDRRDAPPRREFGDRNTSSERRPYGDRSAPGERRPYGDRPPRSTFNERGATGERRPYDNRRGEAAGSAGPRDRSDAPRRFDGDRRDAPPRREFGDRHTAGERRPYGDRSAPDNRRPYGDRNAPGERRPYGDRHPRAPFKERGASGEHGQTAVLASLAPAPAPDARYTVFASCPTGLEAALCDELQALGFEATAARAGCHVETDWTGIQRVNLHARLATRVLVQMGRAPVRQEDDILALSASIPWEQWFGPEHTLRVDTSAIRSPMHSLHYCNLRAKDGICDRLRAREGARPSIDTVRPDARVHLFLDADSATLYLDTSGESLFKRGWRLSKGSAPLRENLAAGLLALSGWTPGTALVDPFCGSGTILIEAAWKALGVPPGIWRPFGFERLRHHDRAAWKALKEEARAQVVSQLTAPIIGSDLDPDAIAACRENLRRAHMTPDTITFVTGDARTLPAPASTGYIVTNPPYGQRLEAGDDDLWQGWASWLKTHYDGWQAYLISAEHDLPGRLRLQPRRRIPVRNGDLDCRLFHFEIQGRQPAPVVTDAGAPANEAPDA